MTNSDKKIKILLPGGSYLYGGGIDYLGNIARALSSETARGEIEVSVSIPRVGFFRKVRVRLKMALRLALPAFSPRKNRENNPDLSKPAKKSSYSVSAKTLVELMHSISDRIRIAYHYDSDRGIKDLIEKMRPDVVLPILPGAPDAYTDSGNRWIGCVFDYQHKYYPEFFTPEVIAERQTTYGKILQGTAVIVNSNATKNDVLKFNPEKKAEIFVCPFSPIANESWFQLIEKTGAFDPVKAKYILPEKYFLISNQFWIHKSYGTAFEALAKLLKIDGCRDIHLVCTGKQYDPRNPNLFNELVAKIGELGIRRNVHFLEFIPKSEQIVIMRNSLALVQPTLFEGWPGGGSVYDAISIGVPCIISDIPVNMEIKDRKNIWFFTARSSDSLRDAMQQLLSAKVTRQNPENLAEASKKAANKLYEKLREAIRYSLNK